MSEQTPFNLMAEKLAEAKAAHAAIVNRWLYDVATLRPVMAPLTRRQRARLRLDRVKHYLRTLWMALRGDDLEPARDWDDY